MTPKCRRVFLLQIVDGYKYSEIAGELGISVVAVKKRLMRAYEICAAFAEEEERGASRRGRRARRAADK
jgi:DNA-directed RNA polymerase specialized sigma24 family protein